MQSKSFLRKEVRKTASQEDRKPRDLYCIPYRLQARLVALQNIRNNGFERPSSGLSVSPSSGLHLRMKKMYHLGNCTTCQEIIKDTGIDKKGFPMQDIKFEKITAAQLDEMKKMAGSYESLFSRRAIKYRELGLKDKKLGEQDYRKYILDEYTFLKRPVVILDDRIFIGNEKKTVAELKKAVK
jgi:arsenate reductase